MDTSEGEGKKTPEFLIFDRIDELENISLKLMEETEATKPTLENVQSLANDTLILAELALVLSFINYSKGSKKYRYYKDDFIEHLRKRGLSTEKLDLINKYFTWACRGFDKLG